jgi:hypothetical protein
MAITTIFSIARAAVIARILVLTSSRAWFSRLAMRQLYIRIAVSRFRFGLAGISILGAIAVAITLIGLVWLGVILFRSNSEA